MIRLSPLFFCSLAMISGCSQGSHFKLQTRTKNYDEHNELRYHLQKVVNEAFSDAIEMDLDGNSDGYQKGIAESEQKIMLLGERINGEDVSNFCGSLASQQYFHVPIHFRDGIHFKPTKQLPVSISNLTVDIPTRWFRDPLQRSPLVYICYEGESFLKMLPVETLPGEWKSHGQSQTIQISNAYNERCRIREILVVLDDYWNKRNLLPRSIPARVVLETTFILPRVTFTQECDPALGLDQPCCLWKFHSVNKHGQRHEFHRCFGNIPSEAVKSTQIPENLADLLTRGMMTRRFLSPPTRVCRAIEFRPMVVRRPDGITLTMNRLDAVKCGAFY